MPNTFRVATFNVENLFSRAKALNYQDQTLGDEILAKVGELQNLLKKPNYTTSDKDQILQLYFDLKDHISIREDRGKLFTKVGWKITGVEANGRAEWDGAIEFKRAKFSEMAKENTAKVIKDVRAHIACIVEVENREVLKSFDAHLMDSHYKYEMLIDGNDSRGIDVGLYSEFLLGGVWTHIFDKKGTQTIFSRDCLEVEITLPNDKKLFMLCNHFKSRGYDYEGKASAKREMQAKRVAEILGKYDLNNDLVAVAGDFNDNPSSSPLQPLLSVSGLSDVLEWKYPDDPLRRWTYSYQQKVEQIDYLLVSNPLKEALKNVGVERKGIYDLERITTSYSGSVDIEKEYDTVHSETDSASDHAAVWAEFKL